MKQRFNDLGVRMLFSVLLISCLSFPDDADECIELCTIQADNCLALADACFAACGDNILCARDCYLGSQHCQTDAIKCVGQCVKEVEEELD